MYASTLFISNRYFNLYRITTINISTNKTCFAYLFTKLDRQTSFWNDQEGCLPPAIYTAV